MAARHGFNFCGISRAERSDEDATHLEEWLSRGYHGTMSYMQNHFEKRVNPAELVPGAKSVITLLYNYFPDKEEAPSGEFRVARYAYGRDYHLVIKEKLRTWMVDLTAEVGEINGRIFVDSAPVMERQWAARSGLGWLGKNTLLINKQYGSYFFIAEAIIDLELEYDGPIKDYCGTCTRCMDACPTQAFAAPYLLDASKCISYLTIELKEEIPEIFRGQNDNWVFGCDICQEVCPWNRFAKPHQEPQFEMTDGVRELMENSRSEFTPEDFNKWFKDSPVKRSKLSGLIRNIRFVKKNPA